MFRLLSVFPFALLITSALAQDSLRYLNEITVTAFKSNRPLSEIAGSISIVDNKMLTRYSGTTLLPAVNSLAGVRMEERSPGSYRFSIRGSLLRSPFGIRNVKFYRDGLPFTDGGGNTYLNILDVGDISSLEIIKGPGASLYGAGTGGVVLLNSSVSNDEATRYSISGGSYGLFRVQANTKLQLSDKAVVAVRSSFQQADGYREQSNMKRFNAGLDWQLDIGEHAKLTSSYLVGNLYYQTPGGLTNVQFEEDPKQARPATNSIPGAVEQKASITNLTNLIATAYEAELSANLLLKAGIIASITDFENPAIRNYEKRIEHNIAFRTEVQYQHQLFTLDNKLSFGGEFQHFNSPLQVYNNTAGIAGQMQTDDLLQSTGGLVFLQNETDLSKSFFLTAGASLNMLRYRFTRKFPTPSIDQNRNFSPGIFPRIGLIKKFDSGFSLHGSVGQGFSPPSLAEVRPSTGSYNNSLNAEIGLNTEVGLRGRLLKKITFDLVAYNFKLKDAIVIQRDNEGAEFFVNAGETSQQGVELSLVYSDLMLWKNNISANGFLSYAGQYYFFKDYIQDGNDFTDNQITGVAPNTLSAGLDILIKQRFFINLTANYYDHIPLNDANTVYAPYFWLVATKVTYKHTGALPVEVFIFMDNLLDERYSLGNDLNAVGSRYYNAAAGRNFSIGIEVTPNRKRRK